MDLLMFQALKKLFWLIARPLIPARLKQDKLAATLESLCRDELSSFCEGPIASRHAAFLEASGSPLRKEDFHRYKAEFVIPLRLETGGDVLHNMVAPTQGVSSLMILGLFDWLGVKQGEGFAHLHGLIEATKQAFIRRNRELGDQANMTVPTQD